MKTNRHLLPIAFLLASCTSLEQFHEMDSSARAEFVCSRDSYYKGLVRAENAGRAIIADIDEALSRGYRVHKSCQNISVPTPGSITCDTRNGYTTCNQSTNYVSQQVCTESPVSIDSALEREKRSNAQAALNETIANKEHTYIECHLKVLAMNPDQAFSYYQNEQ